jgi:hypothetical protein
MTPHNDHFEWNYATAPVGMLQYLTINTHPDIAFVISKVSVFYSPSKEISLNCCENHD